MPKRYGKLAKIMQKQSVNADQVSSASSAAADAASSSVITSIQPEKMIPILEGISARLSDRGDLFKAIKKVAYSVDGLTSALLGKGGAKVDPAIGSADITEADNEAIKRDEKIISLLEIIAGNTGGLTKKPESTKAAEEDKSSFGLGAITAIGVAIAAALGAVVGYIKGYVKLLKRSEEHTSELQSH